jgi:hypothetical protein
MNSGGSCVQEAVEDQRVWAGLANGLLLVLPLTSSSYPGADATKPVTRVGRTEAHPMWATPVTSAQVW